MSYGERYAFYQSKAWKQVRAYVYKRDLGMCTEPKCRNKGKIVHHITWLTDINVTDINVTLHPDNLRLVCKDCHEKIHAKQNNMNVSFDEDGNLIKS